MAFGDPKARFEISAEDKTRRAFRSANSNLKKFEGGVLSLNRALGALAGAAVVTGIVKLGKDAIQSADQIEKMSRRLGTTTEVISKFQFVASQSGIATETMNMALQRMQRRIGEASKGTGEATDALESLGLKATDLVKLSIEDQFLAIADALGGMENASLRNADAMKIFDAEGVAVVQTMEDGAAGIRAMMREAEKLGIVLTEEAARAAVEAQDAMDRMSKAMEGAIRQMLPAIAPVFEEVANWFAEEVPEFVGEATDFFEENKEEIKEFAEEAVEFAKDALGIIQGIASAIAAISAAIDEINLDLDSDEAAQVREEIQRALDLSLVEGQLAELRGEITRTEMALENMAPEGSQFAAVSQQLEDLRAKEEALLKAAERLSIEIRLQTGALEAEAVSAEAAAQFTDAVVDPTQRLADHMRKLAKATGNEEGGAGKSVHDLMQGLVQMRQAMDDSARFMDAVVTPATEQMAETMRAANEEAERRAQAEEEWERIMEGTRSEQERYNDEVERLKQVAKDAGASQEELNEAIKQAQEDILGSETLQIWENTIESMQDAWVTFWEDALIEGSISSFDDFAEELYQIFLKMIARMVAAWTTAWTTDMLGITENAFAGLKIPGIGGGTISVPTGGGNVFGIGLPSASTLAPGPTAGAPGFIGPTAASSATAAFGGTALTAAAFAPAIAGLVDVLTAGPTGPERAAAEFNRAFGASPRFGLGAGAEVAATGPSGTFVGGFAPNSREMNALAETVDQLDDGVSNLSAEFLAAADDVALIGASAEQVGQAWNEVVANDFRAGFDVINQSVEKTTVKLRGDTESWRTLLDEAVAKGAIESFTIMEDEAGRAFARIGGDARDATRVMLDAMTSAGLSVEQTLQLIAQEGELSFEQIRVASELARNGVAIDSAIMRDALAEVESQANESAEAIARMRGAHDGVRDVGASTGTDDPFASPSSPGGAGFRGRGAFDFRAGRGAEHGATVGGIGGTDSQAVTVRATPGERVDFNTQTQVEALRRSNEALLSAVNGMRGDMRRVMAELRSRKKVA